jgi:hypothetical protein
MSAGVCRRIPAYGPRDAGRFTGTCLIALGSCNIVKFTRTVFDMMNDFDGVSCRCLSQRIICATVSQYHNSCRICLPSRVQCSRYEPVSILIDELDSDHKEWSLVQSQFQH